MGRWLFLPNSVLSDLETIARLPVESIVNLRSAINFKKYEDKFAGYVKIAECIGVVDQDAASLYNFWDYVQRERAACQKSGSDVVDEFLAFLESAPRPVGRLEDAELRQIAENIRGKRQHIEDLFGEYPEREYATKAKSLEMGPLPHISNIKAYCDLRPVYDSTGATIVEYLPIVTLRVTTHDSLDEHRDILLQVPESDLAMFEEEFERLRLKLRVLKESAIQRQLPVKKERRRKA
jgi:hypothetical protein